MEHERIECHAAAESRALNIEELVNMAHMIRAEFAKLHGLMAAVNARAETHERN